MGSSLRLCHRQYFCRDQESGDFQGRLHQELVKQWYKKGIVTLLRFNFLPGDTFARLEGLKALIEHAANSIPEMERQAQEGLKSRAESEDWDFGDYCVEQQILGKNYGHWVPQYAGYSALVLLYSIVETQLFACADCVAEDKSFVFRARDIRGSALESSVRFIRKLTSINATEDPAWQHLKDLQALRNIIVHRAGTRGQDIKHQKEFDDLLRCDKERISKIKDLWSGDSLWIPMETCKFFTLEMEQFFKRIFARLGLPAKGVTQEP